MEISLKRGPARPRELTIYRLVQESLTNIGKYAKASKILGTVHQSHQPCVGADTRQRRGLRHHRIRANAHGLLGMRHRVEAAGGSLTVSSTPGEGTLVSAVLPHRIALRPVRRRPTPAHARHLPPRGDSHT